MDKDVPYIVYESEAARHERTVKRLLAALLITILLMVGTNMAWLWVFNQYDIVSEDVTIENSGDAETSNLLGVEKNRTKSKGVMRRSKVTVRNKTK